MSAPLATRFLQMRSRPTERKQAGVLISQFQNVAVDDEVLLGPDTGNAIPEQCIEVEVAVDHGVFRVMPDDAAVAVDSRGMKSGSPAADGS